MDTQDITITIKQFNGSSTPINCPNNSTIIDLKQLLKQHNGYEQTHFRFFKCGSENHLKDNFVLENELILFALPFNPIPNKDTLKEFIEKVNTNTFTEELILEYGIISDWDVTLITDMRDLFKDMIIFNENINDWDVSNVINMYCMFENATSFNKEVNNWNVSNVTNMSRMFENATNFNQPINNWDVSNVTDMCCMFYRAPDFNHPINNWNVSNVTDMCCMFKNATNFNQPINNWNVSNVTCYD